VTAGLDDLRGLFQPLWFYEKSAKPAHLLMPAHTDPRKPVLIYTDAGPSPGIKKKVSVFIRVPGKALGAAPCALPAPGCGNRPAAAAARQLGQTNSNPRTKGKTTVKLEEAITCLTASVGTNVEVLLSGVPSIFGSRQRSVCRT